MKRIARLGSEQFSAADALAGHSELTQILKQHLPPSTVALFAKPKAVDGGVMEWYSELGGQPVPFSQLPPAEADSVKRVLDERLAALLQPVLTFWGHVLQGAAPVPASAATQSAISAGAQPAAGNLPPLPPETSIPPQDEKGPQPKRR